MIQGWSTGRGAPEGVLGVFITCRHQVEMGWFDTVYTFSHLFRQAKEVEEDQDTFYVVLKALVEIIAQEGDAEESLQLSAIELVMVVKQTLLIKTTDFCPNTFQIDTLIARCAYRTIGARMAFFASTVQDRTAPAA